MFNQRRVRRLAADSSPYADIVLATPEDTAGAPTAESPLLLSTLENGITLYTRPT